MKKVALLTMDHRDDSIIYDHLLDQPLIDRGWQPIHLSWQQKSMDWNQFDVVVIRSTWDYQENVEEYLQVLSEINASSARLENPLEIVKWNINKNYLREVEEKGADIVPTVWLDTFNFDLIEGYFQQFNTDQIIIKPTISAGASNTFWLHIDSYSKTKSDLSESLAYHQLMVQPFVEAVLSEGEYSLFYFAGELSHSILKTPKSGDFRVQEEHGGLLQSITPCNELLTAAKKALQTLPKTLLYARIDLVKHENKFKVMEIELIEPSLYFNYDQSAATNFAKALDQWMK
jgi:glutathione synthase/RimK-type ligase-like ATP-grasp enzyme